MFLRLDPFLLSLIGTIILATFFPCQGEMVPVFKALTVIVIAIMFFMQGARLSREAVVRGVMHWRLHLTILCCTFVLFPLLGVAMHWLMPHAVTEDIWLGLLFLCCLPSTVQSSIAFTSIAGGNVPAAVCAATASNIFGMFITPVLVGFVLVRAGASGDGILPIVLQLLLPFALGQILQPFLGQWALRNKKILSLTDRGSILIVVYTAFSAAVVEGLWSSMPISELGVIAVLDSLLLLGVLLFTTYGSRLLGFSKEDEITIMFCGSKKTLASGVPMANVLFPASMVGSVVLPLMLYHQIQLFVCAIIARKYSMKNQK